MNPARHGRSEESVGAVVFGARRREPPPRIVPALDWGPVLPQTRSKSLALVAGGPFGETREPPKPRGWWLGLALLAMLALWLLRWAVETGLPMPKCGFREATGLPCPACGSTRVLAALVGGNMVGAWRLNPLGTVLMVGCALAGVVRLTGHTARLRLLSSPERRRTAGWLLAALVLVNWLYLISRGVP
jgi:hypothetical protein